eukprot:628237-Prymnesium_polylepis.1
MLHNPAAPYANGCNWLPSPCQPTSGNLFDSSVLKEGSATATRSLATVTAPTVVGSVGAERDPFVPFWIPLRDLPFVCFRFPLHVRSVCLQESNELHLACGGNILLLHGGKPTGSGRIEDFERIGPEKRLKMLAAQRTRPWHMQMLSDGYLPLHMLCANPHVSVEAVKSVAKLFPAAAAIPVNTDYGAQYNNYGFRNVLPLHLICLNKSVTIKLFHAVAALYPAALDADCQFWWVSSYFLRESDFQVFMPDDSQFFKPLDLLFKIKPTVSAPCSELVEEIRKLTSPEATAMAEELAAIEIRKAEVKRLCELLPDKLAPEDLATHITTLTSKFQDSDWGVRKMAVKALGKLAPEDLVTHEATLVAKLEDSDSHVRKAAAETLGKLAPE